MYDAVTIEERGKPTVSLVNTGFANDAESAGRGMAMPVLRIVPPPSPANQVSYRISKPESTARWTPSSPALTKPLTAEEKSPKAREHRKAQRIIFKGSLAEVNTFFYRRGWTDGLPIIPPTEEEVAEMLTGTDLPPDKLLGKLQLPQRQSYDRENRYQCRDGRLPADLSAGIDRGTINLLESEPGFLGYTTFGFSTGSWAPFWIINGPIRNEINVNNGSGAFSPGNMANAAIGRAMGLIVKNIGGVRKGVEDMGVMGNPLKYTAVIAENEEESPWEPLHVELGYKKEDSTITVSFPQSYYQHWPYGSDAQSILTSIVDNMPRSMRYNIVMTPPHAKNLAREGYTKEKVKQYIAEHKLVPAARMKAQASTGVNTRTMEALAGLPENDAELVPLIKDPRFIRIIVGGGPGAFIAHLLGGGATPGKKQIQKIELPKNWAKLVAKYKNVVPTYAKY